MIEPMITFTSVIWVGVFSFCIRMIYVEYKNRDLYMVFVFSLLTLISILAILFLIQLYIL